MDKTLVLNKVFELFGQKLEQVEQGIKQSWKDARDAPSAVESYSDGSRREAQEKGVVLEKEKKELQGVLNYLKTLTNKQTPGKAAVGALLQVASSNGEVFYFIVPGFGGDSFVLQEKKVFTLSPESPLGRALLGKKAGEEIVFNYRRLRLTAIS